MVIFLYGSDSFRSKQKLEEIINHYQETKKSGLNLLYTDAGQKEYEDFHDNFKISSMFAEKKLIILKNVFSNKSFQESLLEKIKSLESLSDIIVIYESDKTDERTKLFKALKKECKSQEFELLDGRNLKLWAQKELEKNNQKINIDALDLLLSFVGNDLWKLSQEIKKLSDFKGGSVIRKEDIESLVKPRIEVDIFKTIDALAAKNKAQALDLLQKHVDAGDNPLYLLSMIVYQFRNMLVVKELAAKGLMYASIVKGSGLHPFVVKKNYFACNNFSFQELQTIYEKIFEIDSGIKRGAIEPETALQMLVAQI